MILNKSIKFVKVVVTVLDNLGDDERIHDWLLSFDTDRWGEFEFNFFFIGGVMIFLEINLISR